MLYFWYPVNPVSISFKAKLMNQLEEVKNMFKKLWRDWIRNLVLGLVSRLCMGRQLDSVWSIGYDGCSLPWECFKIKWTCGNCGARLLEIIIWFKKTYNGGHISWCLGYKCFLFRLDTNCYGCHCILTYHFGKHST